MPRHIRRICSAASGKPSNMQAQGLAFGIEYTEKSNAKKWYLNLRRHGWMQTRPAYRGLLVNCQELALSHVTLCIGNNSHPHLDISLGYIFIFQGSTVAFSGSHNNRQSLISEISFSPKRRVTSL